MGNHRTNLVFEGALRKMQVKYKLYTPRNLVQVCESEDFHMDLQGLTYCSLGLSTRTQCPRQAREQDHNGLYRCLDLRFDGKTEYKRSI